MLAACAAAGVARALVTLHVGAGTLQPVRAADIREQRMHGELAEVPAGNSAAVARGRLAPLARAEDGSGVITQFPPCDDSTLHEVQCSACNMT
jgi:hypothetical protein